MVTWNSGQYLKFQRERTQPAIDLAARIAPDGVRKVLDVGCGPGNSTRVLADRFPRAAILGVDSSEAMIETARADHPALRFALCDAARDLGGLDRDFDVVFSNACIQWVPDHPKLLRELLGLLRPGGVLAIQTPMNHDEPIHQIIEELTSGKWKGAFENPRIFYNLSPGRYFDLLDDIAADFTLWRTAYLHVLDSHAAIMEWYRGTGLRPYLQALPAEEAAAFERDVFERVAAAYPAQRNGKVIFPFPRFFILAHPADGSSRPSAAPSP